MIIHTIRFGAREILAGDVFTFPRGILGFSTHRRYALVEAALGAPLHWLQSTDDPALAFLVADPRAFFPTFVVPLRDDVANELKCTNPASINMFAICREVDGWITANLLGPLILNNDTHLGTQVIHISKQWRVREPIIELARRARGVA